MAGWIEVVVAERCSKARRCVIPFHVNALATEALDKVRREVWNETRRAGQADAAHELKGAHFALWKNLENLTECQPSMLADLERLNRPALSGLTDEGAAAPDLPARARGGIRLRVGLLGAALSPEAVR
jgi:transposase